MRRLLATIILLAMLSVPIGQTVANAQNARRLQETDGSENRVALVIGNADYKIGQLTNPTNDVRAMVKTLTSLGFHVLSYENLDRKQMAEAIREFGKRLDSHSIGLFYFSGHGAQVDGHNYLIPIGADIRKESDIPYESIDAGQVLSEMADARSRLNIVILDACRDNPFVNSYRSTQRGLAKMDAPSGTIIAYATAPGSTASDGDGANGLYTEELLRQMKTPGLKIEEVFKGTRVAVKARSMGKQVPWEESSLENDFYFAPKTDPDPGPSPDPPMPHSGGGGRPSNPKSGDVWINPKDGAEMVYVPVGEFTMGGNGYSDEKPQHRVDLDGYWIYKNDVTVKQYKRFCDAIGRKMPEAPSWGWKDDHPVVNVSWDDAVAYCTWAGMRLPTEAEWEKAASGTDGRIYPWGGAWNAGRCANSVGSSRSSTAPVGSYPSGASPYGCLDMVGNVWQWCSDWYGPDYYKSAPTHNPTGPVSGSYRVVRGGSWSNEGPSGFLTAARLRLFPDDRHDDNGFRCASGP